MHSKFMMGKVKEHFRWSAEEYATRKGIVHPEHDPVILNFIRETSFPEAKVLEVGGGSGYFLDLIAKKCLLSTLINCELVPEVYRNQVNKNISLIGGVAQILPFKDNSFDYVIIKNLLHHLVGRSRKESKKQCIRAINEIIRVTKNKGYIIILEQYNKQRLFASIIFYVTLLLSQFKIEFKPLGWGRSVIVSFLTPDEVKRMLNQNKAEVKIVLSKANDLNISRMYRYTLLMSNIGRLLLIGKVYKSVE